MVELILLFFYSYSLSKLANRLNLSATQWIFRFITSFILVYLICFQLFTKHISIKTEEDIRNNLKPVLLFLVLIYTLETVLYFLFKWFMKKENPVVDNNDDKPEQPKKDLSYFR